MAFPADCPHRADFHSSRTKPYEGPVTAMSTAGYSGFPAYSQLHFPRSLLGGAVPGHESGASTLGTFVTPKWRSPFWRARSFLPSSACRHAGRTISSSPPSTRATLGVQSLRILARPLRLYKFPADCPHLSHFHCPRPQPIKGCDHKASSAGYWDVPAYSQVLQQPG